MAANGYQLHILIGNLGADPKTTTFENGSTVVNFDIGVNECNADGTKVVTWYGIAAWNGLGEVCAQYLKKGRQVMVEGTRMRCHAWFGRGNNLYTKMELTANEVKFLGGNGAGYSSSNGHPNGNGGSNRNGNRNYNRNRQKQHPKPQPQRQQQQWIADAPEEVPF